MDTKRNNFPIVKLRFPAIITAVEEFFMPSILLVDDDASVLQNMERLFRVWGRGRFSVKCSPSVGMALSLLKTEHFDVVVTDLCMPVVGGVEFIKILTRFYPAVYRVVMTGFPDEMERNVHLQEDSSTLFIIKPRTSDELQNFYQTIDALSQQTSSYGFSGTVRQVSLGEIIQMYCLNRLSVELVIFGEVSGQIHVLEGELIHAEAGPEEGFKALARLLAAHSGTFETKGLTHVPARTLNEAWERLLLKCAQNLDEESVTEITPVDFSAEDSGNLVGQDVRRTMTAR